MKYNRINDNIFNEKSCSRIIDSIDKRPENNGFGIRYFLRDNPEVLNWITRNSKFIKLVFEYFDDPVIVKSIYFDKPPKSNWPVNWHQDITINLKEKIENRKFLNWRVLPDRVVVQPNIELLQSIMTFRIHLDKADEKNGALSLIDDSENDGIIRIDKEYIDSMIPRISLARIERGGVMIMSPLTVHSSRRSKLDRSRRRVIHIEIAESEKVKDLPFIEYFELN